MLCCYQGANQTKNPQMLSLASSPPADKLEQTIITEIPDWQKILKILKGQYYWNL